MPILLENGTDLLAEDGSQILLESDTDTTPPAIGSLALGTGGLVVTGAMTETCQTASGTTGFSITGSGQSGSQNSSHWSVSGTSFSATFAGLIAGLETLTLSGTATILDLAGNAMVNLSNVSVENDSLVMGIASATIVETGDAIRLVLDIPSLSHGGNGVQGNFASTGFSVDVLGGNFPASLNPANHTLHPNWLTVGLGGTIWTGSAIVTMQYDSGVIVDDGANVLQPFDVSVTNNSTATPTGGAAWVGASGALGLGV